MEIRTNIASGLSPIIKWPGGKEKELKYIIPNAPYFERFIEPFVGGGSVFMGIEAEKYCINDFSSEIPHNQCSQEPWECHSVKKQNH